MKSYQREFCDELKKLIDCDETIRAAANVTSFVEDRADPAQKVQAALGKMGVLVMISATGHSRKPGVGDLTVGDLTVEITCFENPKLNRANKTDAFTLVQAAEAIKDALHGKTVLNAKIRYLDMARADADERDYREIVTFAAFTALDRENAAVWGIGERTLWGEVTQKKIARGGTSIFEPGRDGKARWVGVRDPHWTCDLVCETPSTITDADLPAFGTAFTYGGRSYVTTAADLTESGDDSSTVHLTGRTMN